MMKAVLNDLFEGKRLSVGESRELMSKLVREPINPSQTAAVLAVFRTREATVDELDGFITALSELAIKVDLGGNLIDICGTGGDHKDTFNISTAVAFVLAGAGYRVAKHGNYAVSSSCGSSNVLEALGAKFTNNEDTLRRNLDASGVCFLHAPLFHPALKAVAPIRKELGVRTIFNILGPLINPAAPETQVNGVYEQGLVRLYSYLLRRRKKKFGVVFSLDGYDEISLTSAAKVGWHGGDRRLDAASFGLTALNGSDLKSSGSIAGNAALLRELLQGKGTRAQENAVAANAALAMWCTNENGDLKGYTECALESIRSGRAFNALKASING